jgi:hypothetical protein
MKIACIDIDGEVLANLLPVLRTAGLAVGGSLDRGEPIEITAGPVVRLVVLDEAGSVLPMDASSESLVLVCRSSRRSFARKCRTAFVSTGSMLSRSPAI